MIPNVVRGARMAGLLAYLQGPGQENEHTHPHVVTGHDAVTALGHTGDLTRAQALAIAHEIDLPRTVFGTAVRVPNYVRDGDGRVRTDGAGRKLVDPAEPTRDAHVWHCSLSLRADEGKLSDEKWAAIATEFMDAMGFTEQRSGRCAARWVALHHGPSSDGNDHIHLAASLVREDGTKVDTYRDWPRSQEACRELERRHGLLVVVGRDDGRGRDRSTQRGELFTAARAAGIPQGQVKHATRDGVIEPASARLERIVRACSTAAATEAEFVHAVRREGVLVRPRYGAGDTGDVVGYSVALQPPPTVPGGAQSPHQTIWYGGGKLAKDLTLPRLRRCWAGDPGRASDTPSAWRPAPRPVPAEGVKPARDDTQLALREAQAVRLDLDRWLQDARRIPAADTAAWARFARDTAGILAAWSLRTETRPGPLARAAAVVARSAQLHARDDTTTSTHRVDATATRTWAAMLLAAAPGVNPTLANLAVLAQIVRTVGALADAHHAAGDLHRQQDLTQLAVTDLDEVHRHLAVTDTPSPGPAQTPVSPRQELDEAARLRALTFGSAPLTGRATRRPDASPPLGPAAERQHREQPGRPREHGQHR